MINIIDENQLVFLLTNFDNHEVDQNLRGTYLLIEGNTFVAVDNSCGEAYVEEFKTLEQA